MFSLVLVVVVWRTPRRGSIKKPKGNALGGHAPHTAAPRRGKIIVVSRKGRIFRRTGCCIIAKIPNTRLGNFAFCGARAGC